MKLNITKNSDVKQTDVTSYNYSYDRPADLFYPKQAAVIDSLSKLTVTEGGTKSGKTSSHAIWLVEQAFLGDLGEKFLWVAPSHETAKIGYDLVLTMLRKGGLKAVKDYVSNKQEHSITLFNGAVLRFVGSMNPDSIYGHEYQAVVVDEASRCLWDAWDAIQSTTTQTQAIIKCVGNVTSKHNWFYLLCRDIEEGKIEGEYHKITCWDACEAGVLSKEHLLKLKKRFTEMKWKALYECEACEDGVNPFNVDAIRACIIEPEEVENWQSVVYGLDLARSGNYTALVGMSLDNVVTQVERIQGQWDYQKATIATMVGETPCRADSTGIGDPVVESLQLTHPNIIGEKIASSATKRNLIEGIAIAIQQKQLLIPSTHTILIKELENYEVKYTASGQVTYSGKAHGMDDDTVMALSLALKEKEQMAICSFIPFEFEAGLETYEGHWTDINEFDRCNGNTFDCF